MVYVELGVCGGGGCGWWWVLWCGVVVSRFVGDYLGCCRVVG